MEKPIITVEDSGDERDVKLEKNQKQFSIAGLGIVCSKIFDQNFQDLFLFRCMNLT